MPLLRHPPALLVLVVLAGAPAAKAAPESATAEAKEKGTEASEKSQKTGKLLDGVVNLNTAPPALLLMLPGVGPGRVRDIVSYRSRRPFRTVDELVRIRGIGRQLVRDLRPHLAVAGPSTARGGRSGVISGAAEQSLPPVGAQQAPAAAPPRSVSRPAPARATTGALAAKSRPRPVRSPANQCALPQ